MKSLLASAGAAALLMSAAACDKSETAALDNRNTTEIAANDPAIDEDYGDADVAPASTYTLASGEFEASDLIGAPVRNEAGEEIATVSDVWLGADGGAPMLVIRDGGVAGVGGDLRTIAYDATLITPDPENVDGEPDVFIRATGETVSTLPKFEQATADDFRLASEMIGSTVAVSFNGESARINDLILAQDGQARYAVISPNLASTDQILVDAANISVAEGDTDGELILDVDAEAFTSAPAYPRE